MKKLSSFFLVLVIVWFVGFVMFNHEINNLQIDEETPTDAIVVLTGGRNRIAKAVELLNSGMAEKLFISGVYEKTSLEELQKRKDVELVETQGITLDKKSQNTVENAIEASRWIRENEVESIRLVTSNYHLPRSMIEFKTYNRDLVIVPHFVFSDRVSREWWKSWRSFWLIATEYNKFVYVWLRDFFTPEKGEII